MIGQAINICACGDRDGGRDERIHKGWARAENVGASGEGSNHIAVRGNNHMGAAKGATVTIQLRAAEGVAAILIVRRRLSSYASRQDSLKKNLNPEWAISSGRVPAGAACKVSRCNAANVFGHPIRDPHLIFVQRHCGRRPERTRHQHSEHARHGNDVCCGGIKTSVYGASAFAAKPTGEQASLAQHDLLRQLLYLAALPAGEPLRERTWLRLRIR